MCFCNRSRGQISSKHQGNDQVEITRTTQFIPKDIPEHVDNPFLNRDLRTGILGFRYETKSQGMSLVYSSLEAKSFCIIMKIHPLRNNGNY